MTLTTIDIFLRIHESLQTIIDGIRRKQFLDVIEHLDSTQVMLQEIEIDNDLDLALHKVLRTELCLQREQLLFQLTEAWNDLLRWTLPDDSKRNANKPRTAALEINESEESKFIMAQTTQVMYEMNILHMRLKVLCDRIMMYFVECIIQERNTLIQVVTEKNRSVLCVVQCPQPGGAAAKPPVVPPSEIFPKLEQIFLFLRKPFCDVSIYETVEGKADKTPTSMVQKVGKCICKRLFDYIFNQSLSHTIPQGRRGDWDSFNEVVSLTEKFQELLMSLEFMPTDQSSLMDYFNNVNSLFANMKSQEILRKAHQILTGDLMTLVLVSTDYPLGRDPQRGAAAHGHTGELSPSLVEFVRSCRSDGGAAPRVPACRISLPVRSLICLAYDTVRDAVSGSFDCAVHLSYSLHSVFQLFCDVIPSYHKEKLRKQSLLAGLFLASNACI